MMNEQFKLVSISILLLVATVLNIGCTADHSQPNIEIIQDMMENPAVKAQEFDEWSPNHSGNRLPPEHTIPRGFTPYKCTKDVDCAQKNENPFVGKLEPEVLIVGQKYYETNCAVCHGQKGAGDGSVAAKMPLKPPTLLSDKIKTWKDGQIYHVITEGQGLMGPYASHIPQAYRWQVVNYIRFLQKQ